MNICSGKAIGSWRCMPLREFGISTGDVTTIATVTYIPCEREVSGQSRRAIGDITVPWMAFFSGRPQNTRLSRDHRIWKVRKDSRRFGAEQPRSGWRHREHNGRFQHQQASTSIKKHRGASAGSSEKRFVFEIKFARTAVIDTMALVYIKAQVALLKTHPSLIRINSLQSKLSTSCALSNEFHPP